MHIEIPSHVEYVIIGGGIIGLSIAYHLTRIGHREVLVLERDQLTCGTTWHAAGLVTQLRANENMARLAQYSAELFRYLEQLTDKRLASGRAARSLSPQRRPAWRNSDEDRQWAGLLAWTLR
ncbi:FAD-dependent oxidoreductase [Mesorhizobium sp. M0601]|uniref:FAD-dependent oxidoreductase n=1 Tax=Mesorhizobium sp. M0601 TaxID=2956969 RepID=UPI00333D9C82